MNQDRFKGAIWFPEVHDKTIVIIGAGGTGSWLTLPLARLGNNDIYVIDFDTYEQNNMSGQFLKESDINRSKVEALSENIKNFTGLDIKAINMKFNETSQFVSNIMISCLDNMKYRKIAYNKWKEFVGDEVGVFIDPRMNADQYQVYCVTSGLHNSKIKQEKYEKTLLDDSDIPVTECTFKQTTHIAMRVAATITEMYIAYCLHSSGDDFYTLPFLEEYSQPFMERRLNEGSV